MSFTNDPELKLGPSLFIENSHGIEVAVWPEFDFQNSKAEASIYMYAYTIRIRNLRKDNCQLMTRHWIITDGFNQTEHVVGDGVVGKQPLLRPNEAFVYQSNCPLRTPTGTMKGSFQFVDSEQKIFEVKVPEFRLLHKSLVN